MVGANPKPGHARSAASTVVLATLALAGCGGGATASSDASTVAWASAPADPATDRLCEEAADPAGAPDKVFIHCRMEAERYRAAEAPPATDRATVVAWNVEQGRDIPGLLGALTSGTAMPRPDIVLLSEVDRGCARTGRRQVARELAKALAMDFVYGTEFVELGSGEGSSPHCEIGGAVLSRYPVLSARVLRFATNLSWYGADQNRLGGRIAVIADIDLGKGVLRVVAPHLESSIDEDPHRSAQARELVAEGLASPHPFVLGGDLNAGYFAIDAATGGDLDHTVHPLLSAGFVDAHASLPMEDRVTSLEGLTLDFILGRGASFASPGIFRGALRGLSDHTAIFAEARLPAP